jgi:hypothetical protein
MARLDEAAERVCTRTAQSAARAAMAGASVEATLKGFLSVRRWRGGELDRGGLVVATWRAWACQHMVPTWRGAR